MLRSFDNFMVVCFPTVIEVCYMAGSILIFCFCPGICRRNAANNIVVLHYLGLQNLLLVVLHFFLFFLLEWLRLMCELRIAIVFSNDSNFFLSATINTCTPSHTLTPQRAGYDQ